MVKKILLFLTFFLGIGGLFAPEASAFRNCAISSVPVGGIPRFTSDDGGIYGQAYHMYVYCLGGGCPVGSERNYCGVNPFPDGSFSTDLTGTWNQPGNYRGELRKTGPLCPLDKGSFMPYCTADFTIGPVGPPTCTLSASPTSVPPGGTTVLTWSSTGSPTTCAPSCLAGDCANWTAAPNRGPSGSVGVGPLSVNTTFQLTCTNLAGSGSCTESVTITAPPAAVTCKLYDICDGDNIFIQGKITPPPNFGATGVREGWGYDLTVTGGVGGNFCEENAPGMTGLPGGILSANLANPGWNSVPSGTYAWSLWDENPTLFGCNAWCSPFWIGGPPGCAPSGYCKGNYVVQAAQPENCTNKLDDDGDCKVDSLDSDCAPIPPSICGPGKIPCSDCTCAGDPACLTPKPPAVCAGTSACALCILGYRSDILPFYAANGWPTACSGCNWDKIILNWSGIDSCGYNSFKKGVCASACATPPSCGGEPPPPIEPYEPLACVPVALPGIKCIPTDPRGFTSALFTFIAGLAILLAIIALIIAGYKLIFSGGDKYAVGEAKELATKAISGIAFILGAYLILKTLGTILGIEAFKEMFP